MNGYESTAVIRDSGYGGPIIAVTASALAEEREKCLACGMNDLVTKPFKQADILMIMERYLGIGRQFEVASGSDGGADIPADKEIFDFDAAVDTFVGSVETVLGLLNPLMEKMAGEIETLGTAVVSGDWETVRSVAHSIKGSSRNMDMNRCGDAAADLEAAGKDGDADEARAALNRLEAEYPLLKSRVESILEAQSPDSD